MNKFETIYLELIIILHSQPRTPIPTHPSPLNEQVYNRFFRQNTPSYQTYKDAIHQSLVNQL